MPRRKNVSGGWRVEVFGFVTERNEEGILFVGWIVWGG